MKLNLYPGFPYRQFIKYKLRSRYYPKPITSPADYKRWLLNHYANLFSINCFIETGTAQGTTVEYLAPNFAELHTIELDTKLYHQASVKFQNHDKISCYWGDSALILQKVLTKISQRCLIWLDAHAMIDGVKGDKITPVIEELDTIFNHHRKDHVILIDDARMFDKGSYPHLSQINTMTRQAWPQARFYIKNDVIRIYRTT